MSSQHVNLTVTKILQTFSCKTNPGCACVANLHKPRGKTHCPVCGTVSLWVGEVEGKIKLDPPCGCPGAAARARDMLKEQGIEL